MKTGEIEAEGGEERVERGQIQLKRRGGMEFKCNPRKLDLRFCSSFFFFMPRTKITSKVSEFISTDLPS
jgi:hypothetical protein